MYMKGNSFFADWRDANGSRRRKSFPTATAAIRYENKQRLMRDEAVSNPKPKAQKVSKRRATSCANPARPQSKADTTTTTPKPSKPSRPSATPSRRET
jgi:hypothetical protein